MVVVPEFRREIVTLRERSGLAACLDTAVVHARSVECIRVYVSVGESTRCAIYDTISNIQIIRRMPRMLTPS